LVLVFVIISLGSLFVAPMSALAYSHYGAVVYADYWALGKNTGSLQHYQFYPSDDCTNFASQVLYEGGGLPYNTLDQYGNPLTSSDQRLWSWYPNPPSGPTGSLSWKVADNLNKFLYSYIGTIDQPQLSWTGLTAGDIYLIDLTHSNHPTHTRVWIGYAQVYDDNNNPTGLMGNVADQYTTAYYHTLWSSHWDPSNDKVWKIHLL
jgi:hypothetical protein